MKLESLENFKGNAINNVELTSVIGGKFKMPEHATAGANDVCTGLGCGSYSSDWEDDNGIYYYDWVANGKGC